MIKIQFKNGSTLSFNLRNETDQESWDRFVSGKGWFDSVTALGILARKTLHMLPIPNSGLKAYDLGANLLQDERRNKISGERVWFCVNGLKLVLTVYSGTNKVTRIDIQTEKTNNARNEV